MNIRPMLDSDAERVLAIETIATEFPWRLAQYHNSISAGDSCSVLMLDNTVVGFVIFKTVLDETTLLNIAVDPVSQGKGYGRSLLEFGLAQQRMRGAMQCFLEVRVSNTAAQKLYHSLGFAVVGERKNYYPSLQGKEDALVMRADISKELVTKIYSGAVNASC